MAGDLFGSEDSVTRITKARADVSIFVQEAMQIEEILLKFEHGRKKVLEKPWIARAPFPISRGNRYQILLHGETDPESTMSQE